MCIRDRAYTAESTAFGVAINEKGMYMTPAAGFNLCTVTDLSLIHIYDSFCRYVIQQDINKIAFDLRETHKEDFFSVPEDNPLKDFLQTADEVASEDGDPEQASLAFICKRLKLNLKKLSEEEKKWLKKIAQKSDLLKNPTPQRGRK